MYSKAKIAQLAALLCIVGIPFGSASGSTRTGIAPLMPTKDPLAHYSGMQAYMLSQNTSATAYDRTTMVPLMPTKDRVAHEQSSMQVFPWAKQYPVAQPKAPAQINTQAPLMPTKDPLAHKGDMQQDYTS